MTQRTSDRYQDLDGFMRFVTVTRDKVLALRIHGSSGLSPEDIGASASLHIAADRFAIAESAVDSLMRTTSQSDGSSTACVRAGFVIVDDLLAGIAENGEIVIPEEPGFPSESQSPSLEAFDLAWHISRRELPDTGDGTAQRISGDAMQRVEDLVGDARACVFGSTHSVDSIGSEARKFRTVLSERWRAFAAGELGAPSPYEEAVVDMQQALRELELAEHDYASWIVAWTQCVDLIARQTIAGVVGFSLSPDASTGECDGRFNVDELNMIGLSRAVHSALTPTVGAEMPGR